MPLFMIVTSRRETGSNGPRAREWLSAQGEGRNQTMHHCNEDYSSVNMPLSTIAGTEEIINNEFTNCFGFGII